MSNNQSLRIRLRPSRLLVGALVLVHCLALLAAILGVEGWPRVMVACGILLSAAGTLTQAMQWSAAAAREIELRADGRCGWRDGAGGWHEGTSGGLHFVSAWLVIVSLRTSAAWRKWIVALPDSSDDEALRRLRVWLRWRHEESPNGAKRELSSPAGEKRGQHFRS
jgi:hypothetical protein